MAGCATSVKIMPNRTSLPQGKPPHRVVAVAYDRLCTFEYGIVAEVFGSGRPGPAETGGRWYEFRTAAGEDGRLRGQGALVVEADGGLELLRGAGTIVVPGWRMPRHEVPSALTAALRDAHRNGSRIVSICGGAYVLAAAGLLSGRRATTHWHHAGDFAARFPDVQLEPDVLYVDDEDVLTSAGSAAGLDLCLHILRRDHGPGVANEMARNLVTPPHRSGGQAQYIRRPLPDGSATRLGPLLDWIRGSLSETLSIAQLSARAGMSPRTFCRCFGEATGMTPGTWIMRERLNLARDLLETTRLGIDEVAFRSGFGSPATMRHHFRRTLRVTPTEHRSSFAYD